MHTRTVIYLALISVLVCDVFSKMSLTGLCLIMEHKGPGAIISAVNRCLSVPEIAEYRYVTE